MLGLSSQRHATIHPWAWNRVDQKTLQNGLTGKIHSCLERCLDSHFVRAFLQVHNSLYQLLKTRPEMREERLLQGEIDPEKLTAESIQEHYDTTCPLCPKHLSESEVMNSTEHLLWHCENTHICGVREKTQQDIVNSLVSIGPKDWWRRNAGEDDDALSSKTTIEFLNENTDTIRPAPAEMGVKCGRSPTRKELTTLTLRDTPRPGS